MSMRFNFKKYDLGHVNAGEIIEISSIYNDSNAFLVDQTNYDRFKKNKNFDYFGGQMMISPFVFQIPTSSNWYVVNKEYVRLLQRTEIKIQVLTESKRLSLKPLSHLIYAIESTKKQDVFISYDTQDLDETILELITSLKEKNLRVSSKSIDKQSSENELNALFLDASLVIVILSKNYLQKNKYLAFERISSNQDIEENIILPIWHRSSRNEMFASKELLENNICRNTFSHDLDHISTEISEILR